MVEDRLSEAIAVQIAQLIMSGKLASGTKLKQTELADMLDVSRIPIREALQLLENQGLVKRLETRHIIVADINSELLDETFSVIKAVEKNAFYTIIKHDGWNNVWNGLSMGSMITEEEYAKISYNEHRQIYNAMKEGNAGKAYDKMYEHIMRSRDDMLTYYK